jgi:hypothetical protein
VNDASSPIDAASLAATRRARVRRSALLLGLVALSFYVAFIVMSVSKAG